MSKKRKQDAPRLEDLSFEEALERLTHTDPDELKDTVERARRAEEEVERYVEERRQSIRRGARRAKGPFRI